MEPAPLFHDVAFAPPDGSALWVTAADGCRIRVGVWPEGGAKGTVFLFQGRTEYIEKYGPAAAELGQRGYAMITMDWRGQGLSPRALPDTGTGHVAWFRDYQTDVKATLDAARALELPQPWFMIGHSMGGCIGLRTVMDGTVFRAAAFSAPMWGIRIDPPILRPAAWTLSSLSRLFGQSYRYVPGTRPVTYVLEAPFEDNLLTTDPGMFEMMRTQLRQQPALALGGPSLHWLNEALRETWRLHQRRSPDLPVYTAIGSNERIIDLGRVHNRMGRWPGARFDVIDGAEHELMMEQPDLRRRFYDRVTELFDEHC